MQTFLPFRDFAQSAACLDNRRLGKQRVEVLTILRALSEPRRGYARHPMALAWEGAEGALARYGAAICDEWISRGFKDTVREKLEPWYTLTPLYPVWMYDPGVHNGHRGALYRKDPVHYAQFAQYADWRLLYPVKLTLADEWGYVARDDANGGFYAFDVPHARNRKTVADATRDLIVWDIDGIVYGVANA